MNGAHARRLAMILLAAAAGSAVRSEDAAPPDPSQWRGFNLTQKFHRDGSNGPFVEDDFRLIARWGFNFVRLPMDYRVWIRDGDWRAFDEKVLREIDQAVAWGRQYGMHVCLNFHRAPGYTVASPPEKTSLWSDPETLDVCALHWAMFARRYRDVPPAQLSFNLMNEPNDRVAPAEYARVVKRLVEAIRAESPRRPIIADGLAWGTQPCPGLAPLGVIQATRGYQPMGISHYRASWVHGSDSMPGPQWPAPEVPAYLYGPWKKELASPLVIDGPFPGAMILRLRVGDVSSSARLVVRADDTVILDRRFQAAEGAGRQSTYRPQWKDYQTDFDEDVTARLPAGARRLTVAVEDGDWMRWRALGLTPAGGAEGTEILLLPAVHDWGQAYRPIRFHAGPDGARFLADRMMDRAWLWDRAVAPWKAFEQETGTAVFVGEWGAYNKTPHEVVLRWMRDCLENWKRAEWGWALWNFRGSFGVLDSGRPDVEYEDVEGHRLDRKMLDLLQAY